MREGFSYTKILACERSSGDLQRNWEEGGTLFSLSLQSLAKTTLMYDSQCFRVFKADSQLRAQLLTVSPIHPNSRETGITGITLRARERVSPRSFRQPRTAANPYRTTSVGDKRMF